MNLAKLSMGMVQIGRMLMNNNGKISKKFKDIEHEHKKESNLEHADISQFLKTTKNQTGREKIIKKSKSKPIEHKEYRKEFNPEHNEITKCLKTTKNQKGMITELLYRNKDEDGKFAIESLRNIVKDEHIRDLLIKVILEHIDVPEMTKCLKTTKNKNGKITELIYRNKDVDEKFAIDIFRDIIKDEHIRNLLIKIMIEEGYEIVKKDRRPLPMKPDDSSPKIKFNSGYHTKSK